MIYVYGYKTGCPACTLAKQLLNEHEIEFIFFEVQKGNHPFKTVPQIFNSNGTHFGDYNKLRKEFNNDRS